MIRRRRFRPHVADVVAALPDALLALSYWFVWTQPATRALPSVKRLVLTLLLEFIVIHSAGFMAVIGFSGRGHPRRTVMLIIGLALFYSLFLAAFSAGFEDWWLLTSFWGLVMNRLLGIFVGQAPTDRRQMFVMSTWAFTVAAFLGAVGFGVAANVPRFGVTDAVVQAQHFTVGGEWTEHPWTALAAGTVYFSAVALWELLAPGWLFAADRASMPDMEDLVTESPSDRVTE